MNLQEIEVKDIIEVDRAREYFGEEEDWEEFKISITENGLIQPITVLLLDDGKYKLLVGGRRLKAHRELEIELIPAIVRTDETYLSEKELELIENIHREDFTWWERAQLEKEIFDLHSVEDPEWSQRDEARLTGQSLGRVNQRLQIASVLEHLPQLKEYATEREAFRAMSKMEEAIILKALQSKLVDEIEGEIEAAESHGEELDTKVARITKWAANHYRVGDCREGIAELSDKWGWFAEVDPPYAIDLGEAKKLAPETMEDYNEVRWEDYPDLIGDVASECYRVLQNHTFCIWWFGPTWWELTRDTLRRVGFQVFDIPCIWYKGDAGQSKAPDQNLASCWEPFWVARKGSPTLHRQGRSNVFYYDPVPHQKKIHPTERPIDLMADIISTFAHPGQNMLVPFGGSGATLRAGYRVGSTGLAWDLSEENRNRFLMRVMEEFDNDADDIGS